MATGKHTDDDYVLNTVMGQLILRIRYSGNQVFGITTRGQRRAFIVDTTDLALLKKWLTEHGVD